MKFAVLFCSQAALLRVLPKPKGKAAPAPPLMECGADGDLDIICGTRSPEDLELTRRDVAVVSQMVNGPAGAASPVWCYSISRRKRLLK